MVQKTNAIFITNRISKQIPSGPLNIFDSLINWNNEIKYLGVVIDKRLTFANHIEYVIARANTAIHILYPLLCRKSKLNKEQIIYLQVSYTPIFTYGMPSLCKIADTHINRLQEFERVKDEGLVKHLGVSNFNERQIQRLLDNSKYKPEVLQVELHVYFQQKPLVKFCKDNNIIITAYSPLGSRGIEKLVTGVKIPDILDNPTVIDIAERHGKSAAQILLRYYIEMDVSAIPKSTNADRLKANIDIFNFELNDDDKKQLSNLDAGIRLCDFRNFQFFKGIGTHPEFPF
ncbi:hypothetical protein PVAND_004482 [Polypedilum vanderplanki]|uniref:NADP-dependent oxidoreductase domain-containing protein n=1 Tax=Polypedilum vanderplanki TaxID=319348 RepID=A0A9J6BXV6_POLVA|nr:hypothetical protein PVAND_004482 [Polypedilum vanderplanki]